MQYGGMMAKPDSPLYKKFLATLLSLLLPACGLSTAWAQQSVNVLPVATPGVKGVVPVLSIQNTLAPGALAPVSQNINLGASVRGVNSQTVVPGRPVAAPQAAVSTRQDSSPRVSGKAVADVAGQPSKPAAETDAKAEDDAVTAVTGGLGSKLEQANGDSQATTDVLDQAYAERRAGMDASESVTAAAGNSAVSSPSDGRLKASAGLRTMDWGADMSAVKKVLEAYHDPDGRITDLATMERLLKGYSILNGRLVYAGGNADADLLRRLNGKKFQARGILGAELRGGFISKSIRVYLAAEDGSRKVFLYERDFFRKANAQRYLQSLPVGAAVDVRFRVSYNYRRISSSPFDVEKVERLGAQPSGSADGHDRGPSGKSSKIAAYLISLAGVGAAALGFPAMSFAAGAAQTMALPALGTVLTTACLLSMIAIAGIIHKDRGVEIRQEVPLTATSVAEIQRSLLLQDIAKHDDDSSLKFFLGPTDFKKYPLQNQSALADVTVGIRHPVDVVVTSNLEAGGVKALLSVTGKRYMLPGSSLVMGPVSGELPQSKNRDSQVRRNFFNGYLRDMEFLVMQRAGLPDRVRVNGDLLSAKAYNSIQSLYYGRLGLIDGILIGYDRVITREDLEKYYKDNRMAPEAIDEFNREYINVYKLPTRPLKDFAPDSVPGKEYSLYKPPMEKPKEGDAAGPVFYSDGKPGELALKSQVSEDGLTKATVIDKVPAASDGFLHRDTIFFHDAFADNSASQIVDALVRLDDKKAQAGDRTHILVYQNSPGGSSDSAHELRGTNKSLRTPVDVIVQGMGASGGSWYLSSATGKRFATPNARIMFHEAASAVEKTPVNILNELNDGLDRVTREYVAIVAEASGRDPQEVLTDFNLDVWFNPVEALMYGKKGLIDAVVVGYDRIITREGVEAYLLETLGTAEAVEGYLQRKMEGKRNPRLAMEWRPEKHDENDAFENPLKTITEVARRSAKKLSEVNGFETSVPAADSKRTIDYVDVTADPWRAPAAPGQG